MNFVYPNFLWALLLLAIPVIIHLFNFRRYQTIYFSKVDLLSEAIEDSKSGNKLKHLLVLLARILAIICLVIAFAQPYIATNQQKNIETISSIYIDNSFSMQAQGQDGNLLNEVKNKAIDLVSSFEENEKINLLTSDLLSRDQRFYTKADIIERIKEIDLSAAATPLESATNLQIDLLSNTEGQSDKRLFILSDFQKSTHSIGNLNDSTISPFVYQANAEVSGNVFIDSVWFNSPTQSVSSKTELYFRIKNLSDRTIENLTLSLKINGTEKGVKSVSVGAQSYINEKISYNHIQPGIKQGEVSIKTNQLFFDDQFYFTYEIKESSNILIVNSNTNATNSFDQLFGVDDFYKSKSIGINQLKQEDFKGVVLVILNGIKNLASGTASLLEQALNSGASIVLIPSADADLSSWNRFLGIQKQPLLGSAGTINNSLKYFNSNDPLYFGVFEKKPERYKAAKVLKQYPLLTNSKQRFITLFGTRKSNPFLTYSVTKNGGKIYLQAAPLDADFTDFNKQALFAATYLRIAETAAYQKKLFYTIGQPAAYSLLTELNERKPVRLINDEYRFDVIPSTDIAANSQKVIFDQLDGLLKLSGFYQLTNLDDFTDVIAFNYDREESLTECFGNEELLNAFKEKNWKNITQLELNEKGQLKADSVKPREYWKLFLILTLLFLVAEIALLKWWKTS
ncbi:MAG: BatA and WFA domain-containing protein [Crocinitomicaceae bacterium]